jgi:hypothetical protein
MLRVVSLCAPLGLFCSPRISSGGVWAKTLKKLIGAALLMPSGLSEVTRAIGRGPTKLTRSL